MSDDHRAALREKPTIGLRFRDIERYRSFMAISSDDRFSNDRADDRMIASNGLALTWSIGRL
jgi:hypothetical protein